MADAARAIRDPRHRGAIAERAAVRNIVDGAVRATGTVSHGGHGAELAAALGEPERLAAALPQVEDFVAGQDGTFDVTFRPSLRLGEVPVRANWRPAGPLSWDVTGPAGHPGRAEYPRDIGGRGLITASSPTGSVRGGDSAGRPSAPPGGGSSRCPRRQRGERSYPRRSSAEVTSPNNIRYQVWRGRGRVGVGDDRRGPDVTPRRYLLPKNSSRPTRASIFRYLHRGAPEANAVTRNRLHTPATASRSGASARM